jgi:rhamnosyltransferase
MTDAPSPPERPVSGSLSASVVVRCKDKAETIERTFAALRRQSVAVEIVVVDSGSTDGTLQIAKRYADQLVQITPQEFRFGRALNLGARRASGDIVCALSAHCAPESEHWVRWNLEHYANDGVAAVITESSAPDGSTMASPLRVSAASLPRTPAWGYSNHAGSWRRSVWERFPFDETIVSCEDKEWMWRVLDAGYDMVADARLAVVDRHRRDAGLPALYRRVFKESLVNAVLFDLPAPKATALISQWWSSFPYPSRHPNWLRRLGPARTTELVAQYTGGRAAHRGVATHAPDVPAQPSQALP